MKKYRKYRNIIKNLYGYLSGQPLVNFYNNSPYSREVTGSTGKAGVCLLSVLCGILMMNEFYLFILILADFGKFLL